MATGETPQHSADVPAFDPSWMKAVEGFLREKGFVVVALPEQGCIDIGEQKSAMPGFLGRLMPQTRTLVGHLFFWREERNEEGWMKWNLWVYGEEGKQRMESVAEELSKRFGADIRIMVRHKG